MPIDLTREAKKAKAYLRALAAVVVGDLQSAEPARVLRLPGSFNLKYLPSICPIGTLDSDACDERWCGHGWSPWVPLISTLAAPPGMAGVYRIRRREGRIVYISEGMIKARLAAHYRSATIAKSPQGQALSAARPLSCSWVMNANWQDHQRLELENDLIAAWVLATGTPPSAQFYALGAGRESGS